MHMQKPTVIYEMPIQEKYMLSLKEAGVYFNIGIKKMRRMAELNEGGFALFNGNRWIICRPKFEEYLFLIALMACNRRVLNFHQDAENRLKVVLNKLLRC